MTLAATSLGSALAAIDTSVVIVALPTIERDLGLGFTGQQWVVLSYSVALAALYLVAGAAGDRFGRRRMFLWGALGFAAASALAGAAPDESLLVTARALQGVTGAFLTTNSLALLPLAAVTLALLLGVREPQSSGAERRPFDLAGAALAASGFGLLTFGLVQGQESGYPRVAWALALGAAALIAFPVVERRRCSPMLPLELFARRSFTAANLETFLVYGALGGLVFFFILFLQFIGFSAFEAGLINLPVSVIIIALSPTLGRRADARDPRALLTLGPVLMAAGMAFLLGVSDRSDFWCLALLASCSLRSASLTSSLQSRRRLWPLRRLGSRAWRPASIRPCRGSATLWRSRSPAWSSRSCSSTSPEIHRPCRSSSTTRPRRFETGRQPPSERRSVCASRSRSRSPVRRLRPPCSGTRGRRPRRD